MPSLFDVEFARDLRIIRGICGPYGMLLYVTIII